MFRGGAVGEVDTGDIEAGIDERLQNAGRVGGGSEGGHDAGSSAQGAPRHVGDWIRRALNVNKKAFRKFCGRLGETEAERAGFEPAYRISPVTDLANRRFRPLS